MTILPKANITSIVVSLFLFLFVIISSILASVPPISRDALTHHLAVPKLYLKNGTLTEFPDLLFSYYPMNVDFLYLISLWAGNDIIPKFIHMFFGFATALLIFQYLRKQLNQTWALTGAFLFLTTPITLRLMTSAYVDLGVTFFTTISLLLVLQWSKKQKSNLLIFAGLCAGLAAGTKYNGLITIFLLSCFIPFLSPNGRDNYSAVKKTKLTLLFSCCALLAVSPWLIRNILWTGNPVYPLFDSIFNSGQPMLPQGMNPLLIRKLMYDETLFQSLIMPIRIFFEGQDNNPQFFDGVLNPFLLLLPLAILLKGLPQNHKTDKKLFFWFIILFFLFAFVQRVIRIRYIVPVLPCIVILSIFGLYNLRKFLTSIQAKRTAIILPTFLIVSTFSLNGIYLANYWVEINPLPYVSGELDRTTFISRFWPEYPLIQYANNNLPQSSTILAVFLGNRGYYFDRPVRFDLLSGKSLLCSEIKKQATAKDAAKALSDSGITHILIRQDLFQYWSNQWLTGEEQKKLFHFFGQYTREIATSRNYTLVGISVP